MNNLKQLITATLLLVLLMISKAQNIYTVAGDVNQGFSGDGGLATAGNCELNQPEGVYVDNAGNIYIGDELNDVVRMVNTNGIINVFAGNHTLGLGYSGDSGPATAAQLNNPVGVCGDVNGNIYIADYGNNVIRMVSPAGIITTFAGKGLRGFSGDSGQATAAQLYHPVFIHCDVHGNLYIADYGNERIRKVNTSGIISTIAGNGKSGYTGDGGLADTTELNEASGAIADNVGNVYIADDNNERIRMVNTSGIISTIAGNGYNEYFGGYSGDGGPATNAELAQPQDVYIDTSGNISITDGFNVRIREIDASGIISTIAGNGKAGYTGNGGPATDAELNGPSGICMDSYGNVYFTDQVNELVRAIAYGPLGVNSIENTASINIYPNPANQILNLKTEGLKNERLTTLSIMDVTGREMLNCQLPIRNGLFSVDISSLTTGMYFIRVNANESQLTQKFIKL
jgi:trimeric autotransporter adhesin